jgi:hypothetical protein
MRSLQLIVRNVETGEIVADETRLTSDTDALRLIAAYAYSYAGKWVDGEGNPRVPTSDEVIGAWLDGVVAGSVAHVLSVEKQLAAQAASDGVTAITVS